MKRICSLALFAAAVFFLCCRGAQAEPPVTVEDAAKWQLEQNLTPPVPLYGKLANNVNVRAAPGTDGAKIAAVSGSSVAASVPPIMPVPIATRLLAPAPVATASGVTPAINASEVMMIGRRRV